MENDHWQLAIWIEKSRKSVDIGCEASEMLMEGVC
jgi:hypothetical protein